MSRPSVSHSRVAVVVFALAAVSCSSDGPGKTADPVVLPGAGTGPSGNVAGTGLAGSSAGSVSPPAGRAGTGALAGQPASAGTGAPLPGPAGAGSVVPPPPAAGSGAPSTNAGAGPAPTAGAPGTVTPTPPATAAGPEDGDPSQPVVTVPGINCGPQPSLLGATATNMKIGGRDVHVAYPCNKHKGAPMTFVLNLHGTMPEESLKLYQVAYFSVNTLVNSHNIITVAPKSVVSQWGNGDNGADLPHLMEVIDWVYTTFKDFDIRAMWIGGHSWGAMYTNTFGCRPELASKVKGLILMSGSGVLPPCANKMALISTVAEMDISGPMNQGTVPMAHGCAAAMMTKLGNNDQTLWPNCQPGYVHSNYFMLGKGHIDYMDAEVVKSIADLIKQARP